MTAAKYRILDVTDDGFMTVRWVDENGPTITYPIPHDTDTGDPLADDALEDWLAGQWVVDVETKVSRPKSFDSIRTSEHAPYRSIQAKVDAHRAARDGG